MIPTHMLFAHLLKLTTFVSKLLIFVDFKLRNATMLSKRAKHAEEVAKALNSISLSNLDGIGRESGDLQAVVNDYLFAEPVDDETLSDSDDPSDIDTETDHDSSDEDIPVLDRDAETATEIAAGFIVEMPDAERGKAESFRCSCHYFEGAPCYRQFPVEVMLNKRLTLRELTTAEKDLILLGVISTVANSSEMTCRSRHRVQSQRQFQKSGYLIDGMRVCRDTFKFLFSVSSDKVTALNAWYKENGLCPRKMLSGGRKNNTRVITMQDAERVVNFLTSFTEEHAMILPGRIPGYKHDDLRLLPSCHTKASIHRLYEQSMIAIGDRSICCNSFRQLWKTLLPHIVVARPMTDLCWECQKNNASIARTSNLPEIVKSAKLRKQEDHLKIVHQERQIYKDMVRKHKDAFEFTSEKPTLRQHLPCTSDIRGHYSFDFAQQVHLPSNPLQPGPMYFLCPRKCGIFGVCCEGLPCQVNYLVDEAHCTSKGSNAVISFLDHFFDNYALGENNIDLHCDNCPGQNKNKYMMMYLMWRILTGKHQDISINFLITGHTKFAPDWCFGLLKQKFRKTEVSCLDDLAKCVEASTVTGVNRAQLVGTESGEVFVPQYNWHTFLEPYFRTIPGIKSYHHFRFVASRPGVVAVKEFANSSEKEFVLLKDLECSVPTEKPTPQKPPGLSRERQSYLLDHIREFVRQDVQDVLCPRFE